MKKSNIPFCTNIPETWNEMPNRYLFEKHSQKVGEKASDYQLLSLTTSGVKTKDPNSGGGKVPESYDNYQTVEKGDMVFCLFDLDVSAVFSGLSAIDGMITSAYDVFRAKEKYADNHFLDYWFQYVFSNRYYKMFSKNIRYTITGDMFKSIYTPIPPKNEQIIIGEKLDNECKKIDALIANEEKQIEKLKEYKQSLITEVVTKGLDSNALMKNSGVEWFGEIPEGWQCVSCKYVIETIGDINHYMPKTVNNGYPYLMIGNLAEKISNIDLSKCKQISEKVFEELKVKMQPKNGDVIFARYATIGTVCYVDTDDDFLVSYACVTIRPNKLKINGKFLFYFFKSAAFFEDAKRFINANTQGNIGIEALYNTRITVPPLMEQKELVEYLDNKCDSINKTIDIKKKKIEELYQYKKSIIYEYVTGKKEVN